MNFVFLCRKSERIIRNLEHLPRLQGVVLFKKKEKKNDPSLATGRLLQWQCDYSVFMIERTRYNMLQLQEQRLNKDTTESV